MICKANNTEGKSDIRKTCLARTFVAEKCQVVLCWGFEAPAFDVAPQWCCCRSAAAAVDAERIFFAGAV